MPDHIPELSDALDACSGAFVNIEIKNAPSGPAVDPSEWLAHRVTSLLAHRGDDRRWLLSSFRRQTVDRCRGLRPSIPTAWVTSRITQAHLVSVAAGGHRAIHPEVVHVDAEIIRAAHAIGLAVNPWTCDDPDQLGELMAWGVDGICTNVPDIALAVRAR